MANPFEDTINRGLQGSFAMPTLPSATQKPATPTKPPTSTTTNPTQPSNGYIDTLITALGKSQQPNPMGDLSSVLGSFSSGEKANRVVEGNFQGDFDRMMLDREGRMNSTGLQAQADRNVNESDALRKLQQTSYIGGGGNAMGPMSIMLNGQNRQLPQFSGIAPQATTAAERQGANALQGQVMSRLQPGGSFQPEWNYQPKPVEEYSKPGFLEQMGSYGGAITGGLGAIDKMMNVGQTVSKIPGMVQNIGSGVGKILDFSKGVGGAAAAIPGAADAPALASLLGANPSGAAATGVMGGLSKIMPYAGLATGGLGLMKDQGLGGNVMNGISTGMSLGSIVPGLGTAVGAGVGALAGGARSLIENSKISPELAAFIQQRTQAGTPVDHRKVPNEYQGWGSADPRLG